MSDAMPNEESQPEPTGVRNMSELRNFVNGRAFWGLVKKITKAARLDDDEACDAASNTIEVMITRYLDRGEYIANEYHLAARICKRVAKHIRRSRHKKGFIDVPDQEFWRNLTNPNDVYSEIDEPRSRNSSGLPDCSELNGLLVLELFNRDEQLLLQRRRLNYKLREIAESTGASVTSVHRQEQDLVTKYLDLLSRPGFLAHSVLQRQRQFVAELVEAAVDTVRQFAPERFEPTLIFPLDNHRNVVRLHFTSYKDLSRMTHLTSDCHYGDATVWLTAEATFEPYESSKRKLSWVLDASFPDEVRQISHYELDTVRRARAAKHIEQLLSELKPFRLLYNQGWHFGSGITAKFLQHEELLKSLTVIASGEEPSKQPIAMPTQAGIIYL